ncbi:MAG: RNA 2'-phosphotransferase [Candidatus Hodarchaeales archaeon]|jgi:putative RNA 2'-phosphotransferase
MEKINNPRQRGRLSKFLTLILRHKPELIDNMELDSEGWANIDVNELAQKLSEKDGFDWVTQESIKEIVDTDPKRRYQIENSNIRATYGHSVKIEPFEFSDDIDQLPEFLFYGTDQKELKSLLQLGLVPGNRDRHFLHLSVKKNDALAVARHHSDFPRILKINVPLALATGVRFKQVSPFIVITDEVPPQFIESIPLPPHLQYRTDSKRPYRRDYRERRKFQRPHKKAETIHDVKPEKKPEIKPEKKPVKKLEKKPVKKPEKKSSSKSTIYFETDDDFD